MKTRWTVILASAAVLTLSTVAVAAESPAASPASGKAPTGKDLFLTYKCTSCHSIATEKIEKKKASEPTEGEAAATPADPKKNPDLSGVGAKKDAAWISKYLMKEEKLDDKLHKTKFKGTPEELQVLCAWLASLKTPTKAEKTP
jgi:hypothetical protein